MAGVEFLRPSWSNTISKVRQSLLVLAAGSWILAACNALAQVSEPTQTATPSPPKPMDVATVPATQTPKPSDTPEPTPSPTEPGLQLEVLEWHRWEHPEQESYRGWGFVYALVRNPYGFPVDVIGSPR